MAAAIHAHNYVVAPRPDGIVVLKWRLATNRPGEPLEFLLEDVVDQPAQDPILEGRDANHAWPVALARRHFSRFANDLEVSIFASPTFPLVCFPGR